MRLHRMTDVAEGLAIEADAFAAGDALVRLWMAHDPALVCPASFHRKPGFGAAAAHSASRGWPVHQRPTGGGAVPQGPGILNIALCFTAGADFGIQAGCRMITNIIREAMPPHGPALTEGATPDSFCDGAWNLSVRGQKGVGTAQRIRPLGKGARRVLAHALILMDGEIGPGAAAVNAFHADVGLPPVSAQAHTTLAKAFGPGAADTSKVARSLAASAMPTFAAPSLQIAK